MKNKKITNGKRYVYFSVSGCNAPSDKANGMMVTMMHTGYGLVMFDDDVNGHTGQVPNLNIPQGRGWYVGTGDLFEPKEWAQIVDSIKRIPADKINQVIEFLNK
jgi:hypothetical protein